MLRARLFVVLFAVTLSAHARTTLLEHVPLRWTPTSELRLGAMEMTQTPIQFEPFQDIRNNKEAIGENLEDDKPKPVSTTDDVGAFVSAHMLARRRDKLDLVNKRLKALGGLRAPLPPGVDPMRARMDRKALRGK